MTKTIVAANIKQSVVGYMVNTPLSLDNQKLVLELQQQIINHFAEPIWCAPKESLHITVLDWIAPLVDYGQDKTELLESVYQDYDRFMEESIARQPVININFDTISISRAAIYITGHDDGQFAQIRQAFLDKATLIEGTKMPPTIIHSTIARFTKEIELEPMADFIKGLSVDFRQVVSSFRLVKEVLDPMLEFKTIKEYQLK